MAHEDIVKWLRRSGMHPRVRVWDTIACGVLGYAAYIWFVASALDYSNFGTLEELYSLSGIVMGILFGCYSGFVMSRWWDLRTCTGAVGGSLSDIAMVVRGYLGQVSFDTVPKALVGEIVYKLKLAHGHHISEVLSVSLQKSMQNSAVTVGELVNSSVHDSQLSNLYSSLASVLEMITELSESVKFTDSVKFSLLPAVQADISRAKSGAGDCLMILNSKYPKSFLRVMYFYLGVHFAYLPVYLASKYGTGSCVVYVSALLTFGLILSFVTVLETHFKNPFLYNDFALQNIIGGTLDAIDGLLKEYTCDESKLVELTRASKRPRKKPSKDQ